MSLKITLTIDQESEQGTVLIGLLAKALGRGEAGVSDLRIEREGEVVKPLRAIRQSTVAKLVAAREIAPPRKGSRKDKSAPPREGTGAMLGLRIVASGVPNMNAALGEAFVKAGLSVDGAGATLSKLGKRGYVRNVAKGEWKLTAKGEAVLKGNDTHAKVEHDDRKND
jgi:hypothetical protein